MPTNTSDVVVVKVESTEFILFLHPKKETYTERVVSILHNSRFQILLCLKTIASATLPLALKRVKHPNGQNHLGTECAAAIPRRPSSIDEDAKGLKAIFTIELAVIFLKAKTIAIIEFNTYRWKKYHKVNPVYERFSGFIANVHRDD